MKKITMFLLISFMLLGNVMSVHASDSASASGYGYTLKGSITDTYISASATGAQSSDVNVGLKNIFYLNTAGDEMPVSDRSAMTYITVYKSAAGAGFWKWDSVDVIGIAVSSGGKVQLRTLHN